MTTTTKLPRGKPFQPGQSGNPAGRPRNAGRVAALREHITKDIPAIVRALTTAALAGDVQAARVLLDRALPPLKATDAGQPLTLPAGDLAAQAGAVAVAVAAGELPPDRAAAVLASLRVQHDVRDLAELDARLAAVESAMAAGGRP